MRAVVVGAGIGGLAAAVALRRVGVDVVVYERAARLEAVGAGLALSPNAVRALERLGIADAVRAVAARGSEFVLRASSGATLMALRLDDPLETLGVHRADLQRVLAGAAEADLRLGTPVSDVDAAAREADLVVGADGLNSSVRAHLHGHGAPSFAGYVGWRAVCDFDDPRVHGRFSESWGRGERFGLVPVGGGRLYWFVSESAPLSAIERRGVKDEFARRFAEWHEPIPEAIATTDEAAISATGIWWRKPLRSWGRGRITLLGDAAHPMTPDLGQGAGQALEDAVVLAARVRDVAGVEQGLRRYEQERIARTTPIVMRSRRLGQLASASRGWTCALRDRVIRATPAGVQRRQQAQLLDYALPEL